MPKSQESKQQVKPNQINYTLIALDLLAGVSNDSNYVRHKDIVEVGNKIREMIFNRKTIMQYRDEVVRQVHDKLNGWGGTNPDQIIETAIDYIEKVLL